MTYELSEQLINAIVGYLGKQPYAEVAQLIMEIQREIHEQQEQNE